MDRMNKPNQALHDDWKGLLNLEYVNDTEVKKKIQHWQMDSMLHNFNMLCTNKTLIHNGSNIWLTSLINVLHKMFPLLQQEDFVTAAPDKHREPDEIVVIKKGTLPWLNIHAQNWIFATSS